jgi:tetraacyldisaccharide 4'-kinase
MDWPLPIRLLLWPLSALYAVWMAIRAFLYARGVLRRERLQKPVISVGNLTVGGTGKTPMVIWLAERLASAGQRVTVLSRGYHGKGSSSDEVELMKRRLGENVQFGVGANRFAEARRLEAETDVFLLDDGFQHLKLQRDADILLNDVTRPLQREWLLPAGRLREPLSAAQRADITVLTRTELASSRVALQSGKPIFSATSKFRAWRRAGVYQERQKDGPQPGSAVFAFCGIGNPKAFYGNLGSWGVRIAGNQSFRDHYRYTAEDLRDLQLAAQRAGAASLVTTEKDLANLPPDFPHDLPVFAAVMELEIADEARLMVELRRHIERRGRGGAPS